MRRLTQFLILIVLAILIIPTFLPNNIKAVAEKELEYPVEMVFEEFNNMSEFSKWEPWTHEDSAATKEFYSPYRGKGAGYKWSSKGKSGEITILASTKNDSLVYDLEGYDLGKKSEMIIRFSSETPQTTKVVWTTESEKIKYFSRYYAYFTSDRIKEKLMKGFEFLETKLQNAVSSSENTNNLDSAE